MILSLFHQNHWYMKVYLSQERRNYGITYLFICKVIYVLSFFLIIGSYIQESGHAACDGLPTRAIMMFNKKDIRTIMGIYSRGQER